MKTVLKNWWWLGNGASSSNNSYVQSWLDRGTTLGYTLPSDVTALNTFFNSINSLMSLIEMIKVYALNDATLGNAATLNFKDPTLYQSTLVNSPTYGVNGYISNGTTSYVNGNITVDRRVGIKSDFTSMAFVTADVALSGTNKGIFGAQVAAAQFLISRMTNSTTASFWGYSAAQTIALSGSSHLYGNVGDDGSANTSKGFLDSTYNAAVATVAPTLSYNIFDCCFNNGGSPTQYNDIFPVGIRVEAYEMTPAQIETFRLACVQYKTDAGL